MDSVNQYLQEIGRHPLLTPTEEIQYSRQIQTMLALKDEHPDASTHTREQRFIIRRGQRAKEQMITRNLRLVVVIAKKYVKRCTTMELLDLVQYGNIGLDRATELFDPSRGYKFATYACWWIRQAINRGVQDHDRIIRIPVHRQEKVIKARAYMTRQLALTGKTPSLAQCAEALDISPQELEMSLFIAQDVASLDAHASHNTDKSTIIDLIPDPSSLDAEDPFMLERDIFADVLNTLDDEERELICRYNGFAGHQKATLQKLGDERGLSRERIRQKHTRAMNKLRQRIRTHCHNQGRQLADDAET
jgi:RNA polymerase sigma factor (sigma-70 family)